MKERKRAGDHCGIAMLIRQPRSNSRDIHIFDKLLENGFKECAERPL